MHFENLMLFEDCGNCISMEQSGYISEWQNLFLTLTSSDDRKVHKKDSLCKTKEMKRCIYEQSCSDSGIDCICYKPCAWTGGHSFPEKVKDGPDGACGGCTVSFEEGRNTDNGRYYHSGSCCDYVPVLCERLSKDHPGTFPYSRIRTDWISG